MILQDLETARMRFDPKLADVELIEKLHSMIPELVHFNTLPFEKAAIYRYALLMYDPESPVVETMDDYWARKFEVCETVGFKTDDKGRFSKEVEDIIMGRNEDINDVFITVAAFIGKVKWSQLIYFSEALANYEKKAMKGDQQKSTDIAAVDTLYTKIMDAQNVLLQRGDETEEFLDRFYYRIEKQRLSKRVEDFAKRVSEGDTLNEYCPYGKEYRIEPIEFVGEKEPAKKRPVKKRKNGGNKRTKGVSGS